ncbi:MAG: integrin alpha, partial [Candidatus Hodarchaeales archaeon]
KGVGFKGETENDLTCFRLSKVSDVISDDNANFIIGESFNSEDGVGAVQINFKLGHPPNRWLVEYSLSQSKASLIGERGLDNSGMSVSRAGDINNDGYVDFIIGAPEEIVGGIIHGQVYLIFSWSSDAWSMDVPLSLADASFIGEYPDNDVDNSVSGLGDVNNDD